MVLSLWFEGSAKWRTSAGDDGGIGVWTAGPGTCGAGVRMRLLPGAAPCAPAPPHLRAAPCTQEQRGVRW